jgi:hypothetical protein
VKKIIIHIIFFIPLFSFSQEVIINTSFDVAKTDHLRNIYLLENNTLSKYSINGEFLFSFNNANVGTISSFDVSDPMKILVFDKDFNQIIFLNTQLSILNDPINIDELDIPLSELACKSTKEGYWVYDGTSREIKYFNKLNQLIHKSIKIDQLIQYSLAPDFMIERNNQLFLCFEYFGILVFDNFGSFVKKIPIKDLKSFQIETDEIVYFRNDTLFKYNYTLHTKSSNVIYSSYKLQNVIIQNDLLILINESSIEIRNQ